MLNKYNGCRYIGNGRQFRLSLQLWQAKWAITSQMDPCSIIKYLLSHLSGLDWRRAAQLHHTHDPAPDSTLCRLVTTRYPPRLISSPPPARLGAWQLAGGRGGGWQWWWSPELVAGGGPSEDWVVSTRSRTATTQTRGHAQGGHYKFSQSQRTPLLGPSPTSN